MHLRVYKRYVCFGSARITMGLLTFAHLYTCLHEVRGKCITVHFRVMSFLV